MDKEFFLQELEKQSGMLYRVAFTILHDDYACEDAMQKTALKAREKRNSLREERYFRTWITREPLMIPVGRRLAEKTYTTDAPCTVDGAQMESIRAELYVTGAYLTCSWRLPDGLVHDDEFNMWAYHSDELLLADGAFNVFERGVSLSACCDDSAWPVVTVEEMLNVDALPEVIRISDGTNKAVYE